MKSKTSTPKISERIGQPMVQKTDEGKIQIMCCFCKPSHPLNLGGVSACGTQLQIRAVQTTIRAKYDKKLVCVKCGKGDGMMVMFQGAFIHTHDCAPGVIAMTQPPEYSKFAKVVFGIKNERLKKLVEGYTGRAVMVEEVTPEAVKTGVIFGYYFNKENKNGKYSQADARR